MVKKKTIGKHLRAKASTHSPPASPIDTSEPRVELTAEEPIHHGEAGSNHPNHAEPSMQGDDEEAVPLGMEIAIWAPLPAKYMDILDTCRPNIIMGQETRSKRFFDRGASSSAVVRGTEGAKPDEDTAREDMLVDEAPAMNIQAGRRRAQGAGSEDKRKRRRPDDDEEPLDSSGEPARPDVSSDEEVSGWGEVPERYKNIPDTPLLTGLSSHLSVFARPNSAEPTIYSGFRGAWQQAYDLYSTASEDVQDQLSISGFGSFVMIRPFRGDRKWVLALCERWFDETNTFHFPCCEMGITPLDFVMLTGLRFGGTPLRLGRISQARILDLMGVPPEDRGTSKKVIFDRGLKVRVVWLKETLMHAHLHRLSSDEPEFPFLFRRLLLYILGQCFFPEDRSSVDGRYLQWMDPLDRIGSYDWGSSIYAVILRGLRRLTRLRGHSCRFFSPILELWAREYLAPFCPQISEPTHSFFPRSRRWELPSVKTKRHLLHKAREELDRMDASGITPRPYHGLDRSVLSRAEVIEAILLSKRQVFFSSFLSDEYYLGERMMYQTQGSLWVPHAPPLPMTFRFSVRRCREQMETRGLPASELVHADRDYTPWYRRMSVGCLLEPITVRVGATYIGGDVVEAFRTELPHARTQIIRLEGEIYQLRIITASCPNCYAATSEIPTLISRTGSDDEVPGSSFAHSSAHAGPSQRSYSSSVP